MSGLNVDIRGLSRTYFKGSRPIEVLRDVTLSLAAGDRLAIIGPSGSGKSTFLHAVGLLDQQWDNSLWSWASRVVADGWIRTMRSRSAPAAAQTTGRLLLDGRDVSVLGESQRAQIRNARIGFVFQAHHLLPEHSALGNVMIPVRLAGAPEEVARRRAAALLDAVGLGHRTDHRPGEMSGGEQQRVAIARALVMGPGLVLADEPTGNLDPRTAASVFALLVDLNVQLGSTLVVVTHSRELASKFPRRVALEDGQFRDW